uniref:dUTPase-like domain-containing protein n=1 Tax=viral metagenome TaxID=1070528 RepID=A0A6C0JGW6_9ZZZZ
MTENHTQNIFNLICNSFPNTCHNFAILKLAVNYNNADLKDLYYKKVDAHNEAMLSNPFPDSGFDLFVPEPVVFSDENNSKFIDFQVKTEMLYCNVATNTMRTCGYYIYPRSSISKTPLMLANHTGIIDSGYRGSLIGAFRWLRFLNSSSDFYALDPYTRLTQICHPTLCPIYVVIVDESQLSTTERNDGGFGSTGTGV